MRHQDASERGRASCHSGDPNPWPIDTPEGAAFEKGLKIERGVAERPTGDPEYEAKVAAVREQQARTWNTWKNANLSHYWGGR